MFWCLFISKYGLKEYNMIGSRTMNAELAEKQRMSADLAKSPDKLKMTNINPSKQKIQELISHISVQNKDDFDSLIPMAAYYGMDVHVRFQNNICLSILCGNGNPHVVFLFGRKVGKYNNWVFSVAGGAASIDTWKSECYFMESREKPIKGISAYKVGELIELAGKLCVELSEKDGKKEMYDKIGTCIGKNI